MFDKEGFYIKIQNQINLIKNSLFSFLDNHYVNHDDNLVLNNFDDVMILDNLVLSEFDNLVYMDFLL